MQHLMEGALFFLAAPILVYYYLKLKQCSKLCLVYHSISSTKTNSAAPNDLSRPRQISKLLLDGVGRRTIVNSINNYSFIDQPPRATPLPGISCSIFILMPQHPKRAGILIPIQWVRMRRVREVKRVAPKADSKAGVSSLESVHPIC